MIICGKKSLGGILDGVLDCDWFDGGGEGFSISRIFLQRDLVKV